MNTKLKEEIDLAAKQTGTPLPIVGDDQQTHYVVLSADQYERVRSHFEERRVDPEALKQAILNRRDESRRLNEEWEHVDAETWPEDSSTTE